MTLKVPSRGNRSISRCPSSLPAFTSIRSPAGRDRPAFHLHFESGDGTATGAFYDPATHELLMKKRRGDPLDAEGPHAKPMKIEAAAWCITRQRRICLKPWGRLTRENTVAEGENPVVTFKTWRPEAVIARSTPRRTAPTYPNRKLQYSADEL